MIEYPSVPARYISTGVSVYAGNPLIEALPPLEQSKDQILDRITYMPPLFKPADIRKGDIVRIAELARLGSLVYSFAEYKEAASNATVNIRSAYICRNPMNVAGQRRRHLVCCDHKLPKSLKSTALSQLIQGVTGSGKTTFGGGFLPPYLVVIEHSRYKGERFECRQIPAISMLIPHDASLKSFCLQFFSIIDNILKNTHYMREAWSVRSIPNMAMLLQRVATAVSLGMIFVDDLQNLRSARSSHAEVVLNLLSQIIETAGVSLIVSATPALRPVIEKSARNIRKLTSGGSCIFPVMRRHDPQWEALCHLLWKYQLVRNPCKLNSTILNAWYRACGGNPALTAMSFVLAQRRAIGAREVVDELEFERIAMTEMAFMQPAISALIQGTPEALAAFDDLLLKEDFLTLQQDIGFAGPPDEPALTDEEFDEIEEPEKRANAKALRKSQPKLSAKRPARGLKPRPHAKAAAPDTNAIRMRAPDPARKSNQCKAAGKLPMVRPVF